MFKHMFHAGLLALILLLQACGTAPVKTQEYNKTAVAKDSELFIGSIALAKRLGAANTSETITTRNSAGAIEKEYRVVSEYTAASGNTCRRVRVEAKKANLVNSDLICRSPVRSWYWPPEIISD